MLSNLEHRRQVRVLPEGGRTCLTLVEHGQVLVEREVDSHRLIEHLTREGQTRAALAQLLPTPSPD